MVENETEEYELMELPEQSKIEIINSKRDMDLFWLNHNNIRISKDTIKDMAVKFMTMGETEKVTWFDNDNKPVTMTKVFFGQFIKQATNKVEKIIVDAIKAKAKIRNKK